MSHQFEDLRFVIVGHVDHGKSTLIGRLLYETDSIPPNTVEKIKVESEKQGRKLELSFIIDQLKEERDKSITIDTSQTFFFSDCRKYILIDAPGHQEYLKNMITGASHADFAVLIIAADRGVEDQTRRHAYLIKLMGIKKIICAINKIDLCKDPQSRFKIVSQEIKKYAASIGLDIDSSIPISASEGLNVVSPNLNWFDGPSLLQKFEEYDTPSNHDLELRIAIQGELPGQIYCGVITSGTLSPQSKLFHPGGNEIESFQLVKYIDEQVAIDKQRLADQTIALKSSTPLSRGDILTDTKPPTPFYSHKVKMFWMNDKIPTNQEYTIRIATQKAQAQISQIYQMIDPSSLENVSELTTSAIATAQITFNRKVFIDSHSDYRFTNSFVLEEQGQQIAGGVFI